MSLVNCVSCVLRTNHSCRTTYIVKWGKTARRHFNDFVKSVDQSSRRVPCHDTFEATVAADVSTFKAAKLLYDLRLRSEYPGAPT